MASVTAPKPFTIAFTDEQVADLKARLSRTRWPDQIPGSGWDYGVDSPVLRELVAHWASDYDWRERERRLNAEPHFTADIDGTRIHFIHKRASASVGGGRRVIPLLLLHGWPGSFVQMLPLIPLLTEATAPDAPVFDVVIPSLPGYGLSAIPDVRGMSAPRIAPLMHTLMTEVLRYTRYGMRSSDLGAGVAVRIAADHQGSIIGSHTGGTNPYIGQVPADLAAEEQAFVETAQAWSQSEMAYALEHSSKPQTIAHALNDSPAGLAAWIVEKVWRWGDVSIPLEQRIDRASLLDNLTIYWMTGTIGSSMRLYYETARDPNAWARPDVPTAYLMSPHDMFATPRRWIERSARVDRWTEIDRGGHFLEWEVPQLVAADLRAFFGTLG